VEQQLIISRGSDLTRVALLEDGRAVGLYVEPLDRRCPVGNIYRGRVERVLAGMDAAFVDIGFERNGFLPVDEVLRPGERSKGDKKISSLLKGGKEVLVQVTRDAMGGKGPRLTTHLHLVGRYLVFSPLTSTSGASRRLSDAERVRLRGLCTALGGGEAGLIARTAAEGAEEATLVRDLRFLRRVWALVEQGAVRDGAPALLFQEQELPLRAVRDLFGPEFGRVVVDDAGLHRSLGNYLRAVAPRARDLVELYQGNAPLFEKYGLEEEFEKALARRVELRSGGHIVIDHTEAMTVIDVNTGSYVRGRHLEDTVLRTNVEACGEIVRQLRLRDIGGIIVIDFIDMAAQANKEAVLATLKAESARDRTKSYVVEISPLGLVEMTRQNTAPALREMLTRQCPVCQGVGRVRAKHPAPPAE
jgi:ribonuclease G